MTNICTNFPYLALIVVILPKKKNHFSVKNMRLHRVHIIIQYGDEIIWDITFQPWENKTLVN